MKVKFKSGYMGRETHNVWIPAGVEYEIDDEEHHLIDVGLAVEVKEPAQPVEPEPKTVKVKRSAKK